MTDNVCATIVGALAALLGNNKPKEYVDESPSQHLAKNLHDPYSRRL